MTPTATPEVTARTLATAGRTQLLIDCPRCWATHRHIDTGLRRGPCGARYTVTTSPKEPTP